MIRNLLTRGMGEGERAYKIETRYFLIRVLTANEWSCSSILCVYKNNVKAWVELGFDYGRCFVVKEKTKLELNY